MNNRYEGIYENGIPIDIYYAIVKQTPCVLYKDVNNTYSSISSTLCTKIYQIIPFKLGYSEFPFCTLPIYDKDTKQCAFLNCRNILYWDNINDFINQISTRMTDELLFFTDGRLPIQVKVISHISYLN